MLHVTTYVHGVSPGGLLAGVSLGQRPVQRVGEGVFSEVGENLVVNFKGGEVR